MTLNAYTGQVTLPNASGNVAYTGLGFQPKAIIFWSQGSATAEDTWTASIQSLFGWTVGSGAGNSGAFCGHHQDNQATASPNVVNHSTSQPIIFGKYGTGGTVTDAASLVSFDSDGFTLNWTRSTDAGSPPDGAIVHYLALGGSSLSADIINWNVPNATGNTSRTGLSFRPDVVLHLVGIRNQQVGDEGAGVGGYWGLGAMDDAGNEWCIYNTDENALATTETASYHRTDKCIGQLNTSSHAVWNEAEYVSMNSDGFTVNFTTVDATNPQEAVSSLCLSGLNVKAGFFAKDTGAAPDTQAVTGLGFSPDALLLASVARTAGTTPDTTADAVMAIGAADGTRERSSLAVSRDNQANSDTGGIVQSDKVLALRGGGTLTAVDSEADLTSFDADGFTLTWTTNDATADQVMYVAFAPPNVAPNAPVLDFPIDDEVVDLASTITFMWTFSDPDVGDTQSDAELRYRDVGNPSWTTITGIGTDEFYDLAGGTLTADDYEWQVRTYDAESAVGPWSASETFTAAAAPAAPTITAPAAPNTIIATALYTVTWTAPDQAAYQVRTVADNAGSPNTGTVYFDTGTVVSTNKQATVEFLTNNRFEHVQVRVRSALGLWSPYATVRVEVAYDEPPIPLLTVTKDEATDLIYLTVTNPAPTGSEPALDYNEVWVRVKFPGTADVDRPASPAANDLTEPGLRLATGLAGNVTWVDGRDGLGAPASGVDYEYRIRAVGVNTVTSDSDWEG